MNMGPTIGKGSHVRLKAGAHTYAPSPTDRTMALSHEDVITLTDVFPSGMGPYGKYTGPDGKTYEILLEKLELATPKRPTKAKIKVGDTVQVMRNVVNAHHPDTLTKLLGPGDTVVVSEVWPKTIAYTVHDGGYNTLPIEDVELVDPPADVRTPPAWAPAPFWMIWVEGKGNPSFRHLTEDEARHEAERLAKLNPDTRVYVLKTTTACRVSLPAPEWAEPTPCPSQS